MIFISHRGNLEGRVEPSENSPSYIDYALNSKYDVEIDLWVENNSLWLGHDKPQYKCDLNWLEKRIYKLWIHCKNIQSLEFFNHNKHFHYFWHETDTVTLTSRKFIWAYPGKQPIKNSIAVMPEIYQDDINDCVGICSDFIKKYKND